MMNYTQGGQALGLKALAQELPQYGRYGDDIVAHISSDEAKMLQAMGGSGTINPVTGLPELFKLGNPFKPLQNAAAFINPFNPGSGLNKGINQIPIVGDINKGINQLGTQIFQPLEKAIVKPISRELANFEKEVNKVVPGGYATLGQIALAASGAPVPLQVAYGAARGSGVMRKGGSFDVKGAVIGGATAYATAELGEYMRNAVPPGSDAAMLPVSVSDQSTDILTGQLITPDVVPSSPVFQFGTEAATPELLNPSLGTGLDAGDFTNFMDVAPKDPLIQLSGPGSVYDVPPSPSFLDRVGTNIGKATGDTGRYLSDPGAALSKTAQTGEGIKNLLGAGDITAKEAVALAAKTGINPTTMAGLAIFGETSLAGFEEQRKYLEESRKANAINQAEYDEAMASIIKQRDYAESIVNQNPINPNPNRDVSIGETFYGRSGENQNIYDRAPNYNSTLYAMGGSVDDESGMDEARGLGLGNLSNGFMNMGSTPRYDAGGKISTSNKNKERNEYLNMLDAEFMFPPSQYIEGMGFTSSPQSVSGRIGTNFDALGGNLRAGLSGAAMKSPEGNIITKPGMFDIGYKSQIGSGDLDIGLQRAIQSMPGKNKNYAINANYKMRFAEGGQPRFLSGGGDGMSDSIKATIEDKQEARLADGEFIIPADVVSHIGNGSSKAGAKQLYSMMNKVRQARTGNPKQGKQINPRKYLPA